MAPPGSCSVCFAKTVGWTTVCGWCGSDIRQSIEPWQPAEDTTEPQAPAALTVIEGKAPRNATLAQRTARRQSGSTLEASADPVHELRGRLDVSSASSARRSRDPHVPVSAASGNGVLASAVYLAGTPGLQVGNRYGIALIGPDLAILGPVDVDPSAVRVTRSLQGMDATGIEGRLVITSGERRSDQFAVVFMAVAGGTVEGIADVIVAAAAAAGDTAAAQ